MYKNKRITSLLMLITFAFFTITAGNGYAHEHSHPHTHPEDRGVGDIVWDVVKAVGGTFGTAALGYHEKKIVPIVTIIAPTVITAFIPKKR